MKKILLLLFLVLVTGLAAGAQTFTVENNGNQFTIKRSGSNLPAQTVRYRTVSLSALAGVHFTDASGTLAFNAGDTVLSVTVTEPPNVDDVYRFQTTTSRSYRFEVLEYNGTFLASVNRSIEYGNTYQHTASYVNKSVTDLVYFDNSGNIKSGSGNKYLDVSYSSSSWIQVDDGGYNQAVHSVSTGELFHGSNALRTYLNNQNNKMYATVYFQQKEEQDGYQYIQILADNASTYDGNDPNGAVNDPSLSLYKACFILSYDPSGSVMSDTHYQFFPHRYDYVDKAAETSAGITHYEFDYDNSHLYQQKYKASSYNAANNGALSLAPSVKNLNVRFDAAGSGGDDWDFKNLKVRLALVDEAKPSPVAGNAQVSAGPYVSGTTVYVSVPFSEIVTATSSATLTTSWGTLSYYGGSGSNVLTFSGEIDAPAGTQLIISALSGSITDLAGNTLSTNNVYKQFSATVIAKHAISLPSETPNGTMTSDKATALAGETVTLTAIPDAGYSLVALDVMNGNTPVATSAGGNNTYTFVMPDADVTVGALFALPIDATNFPDEYFRNYLLAQDYGSDGLLTHEEIASITEMNLNSQQIADLTGIGYFVALKELSCSWNPLTTIDMSQNTALQVLDCHATALASLNVSQNTALTTLRCYNDYGNLPLSSLDVSHNPALSELDCHGCQLGTLDVSHNTALSRLDCHNCQLTSLDVSNNPALMYLFCNNNQLTALDVSSNTALHTLICNDNQLTALDLSQNSNLFYLDCSHNQIAALGVNDRLYLETIVCEYNQLTALNVNGCRRLSSLKCSNNQINAVNMETLVASMPTADNSYGNHGHFYVIDLDSETEQNVITSTQVAMAIGKNWIVQGFTNGNWEEYDGVLAIDATNFPDENFRNYLLAQDYGSDGVLTAEEIAGITYINVAMKFISDMTGIEHFTALTKLDCFANHYITTLDVSHNTALKELNCDNNKLQALDVSNNTALTALQCGLNQLTSLDVSQNTALTYLECQSNQLQTLDVSQNTALQTLYCNNNQLASLDVSQNTELTDLRCSSNQLTALDVSHNTNLKDLQCFKNQLTALDVSQNPALRTLFCHTNQLTALDVSHNTALRSFFCHTNQLTALDVSHNTALISLQCYNNQLTALDVSHNTDLISLDCYNNQIFGENMAALVASMPTVDVANNDGENGNFIVIDLYSETEQNIITTTQVETARGKNWTVYGIANNDWVAYDGSPDGLPIDSINFPDANFRNWLLAQDYGSNGFLTDEEIADVIEINVAYKSIADLTGIEHFTALETLNCSRNQLTALDVSQNTALTRLDCYLNQLTALDVSHNTALTILYCSDNQIDTLDVSQNTALETLDCSRNQLTALDVSHNSALTIFYCSNNQIDTLDVSHNTALTSLSCVSNQLGTLDVSHNTTLTSLFCNINQLTSLDVSHNTALTILQCSNNLLTTLDVSQNTALKEFNCSYNQLTALDVSNNTALTKLYCYDNQINGGNMAALVASMPTVDVDSNHGIDGEFYVIDLDSETEQNVITTTQVTTARGKHWQVISCANGNWVAYDGSSNSLPIDSINFPDENFRNFLLSKDYGSDGFLTDAEIAGITSIDVSYREIADLTGIEYFTALTSLDVSHNQLTSLDVSHNTALKQFYCFGNQLTSLDVSHNTALEDFQCNGNQLTSLEVSQNTALVALYCYGNQLTTLDVSQNTALTRLYCYSNQLTSLDVSHNTNLQNLQCQFNQLTVLDLGSELMALQKLYCYNNQINGENMETLVTNLNYGGGEFRVIDLDSDTEQNVITTTQVATARGKNWTVLGRTNGNWVEYDGSEPTTAVPGDVDGDGYVTTVDITAIYNYLLSSDETYISTSDVDGDGFITTTDITVIYNILLGSKGGVSSEDN